MKIIINYDLLEKVNTANGNLNLQRIMLNELKLQTIVFGTLTGIDLIVHGSAGIRWMSNLMVCSYWFLAKVTLASMLHHKLKDRIQHASYLELAKLAVKLENLNMHTSSDLLKDSTLIKTEYKLVHESFSPIIQQNKYILVPTYDGLGDIKDMSILQEHEIGSKQYTLSIGSPSRKFKLAHSYN